MPERKKLNLELNKPTVFELLFNEPTVGNSRFGDYYLYSIKNEDSKEFSFFASNDAHRKLKNLRKGDKIEITKISERKGNKVKTRFVVKPLTNPEGKDNFYDIMLKSYQDALRIQSELKENIHINK